MNQFVESMKRLYTNGKIGNEKVIELFTEKKITEEEKWYILNIKSNNLDVK